MLIASVLGSVALAAEGNGSATIVWMQEALPSDDARARAERLIGTSAAHAAWSDIAFPATPFTKEDEARLAALDRAKTDARARWDAFDVELEIASALATVIAPIEILRDDADRKALAEGLLLEGAAALRAVPEAKFATAEEVGPYRIFLGSTAEVKPLVSALCLDANTVWMRSDLPDAASYTRVSTARDELAAQPTAHLAVSALPAGTTLVLDGHPLADGTWEAPFAPGHHYLHFLVDGHVVGRRVFDAEPGSAVAVEPTVSREELVAASNRVLEGSTQVPDDITRAVETAGKRGGRSTPTFLATLDAKGNVKVIPFGNGAAIQHKPAVTVILAGSAGGGLMHSSAFTGLVDDPTFTAAIGGDLGAELGIYNLAIFAGSSLVLTPNEATAYRNSAGTGNDESKVSFRPYGGLGVYLPRPDPGKPLFLLGADYGWLSPGALGVGGRMSVGIPLDTDGTWFRIQADAFRGTQMTGFPAEGEPTVFGELQLGFGRLL